ncbi:MAG: hypothetical protein AAGA54_05820 [Myxococcota bacterium]
MLPCPSCARHVHPAEQACPFCGATLRSTAPAFLARPVIVIAVGAVLAACGPASTGMGDTIEGTTASDDDTTSTTAPGTTAPGTTDGPGQTSAPPTSSTTGMRETGSTTMGGGSTTWDDDTFDTCGGFYGGCPTDNPGVSYECDVWEQDCDRDEKCIPWGNDGGEYFNASRCVPVDPSPVGVGAPCTVEGSPFSGIDDCEAAAMCVGVDPESLEGTCVALCSGSLENPTCTEGTCLLHYGWVPTCMAACDPELDECPQGQTCLPTEAGSACVWNGSFPVGTDCIPYGGCETGAVCVDQAQAPDCGWDFCCAAQCDPAADACGEGLVCTPLPGQPTLGSCAPA